MVKSEKESIRAVAVSFTIAVFIWLLLLGMQSIYESFQWNDAKEHYEVTAPAENVEATAPEVSKKEFDDVQEPEEPEKSKDTGFFSRFFK